MIEIKIDTTRFGELEIDPQDIIEFPLGILGFETYSRYVILKQQDSLFTLMQSVDEPWLCFVLIMPELLRSDYQVDLEPRYVEELQFEDASDGEVFVIVTVPEEITEMTANLQAPLIINQKKKLGKQLILMDGTYKVRHNVLAELQRTSFLASKANTK